MPAFRLLASTLAFSLLLTGCSALRLAGHFTGVNIGEQAGTRTLSSSPSRDRYLLIDVEAAPAPEAPPPSSQAPIVVDIPAPAPPPTSTVENPGPPTDIVALALQCKEVSRPQVVESEHLTLSFGFIEKLVYGIVMLFEAAAFVGVVLSYFREQNPAELVPSLTFATLFGADFLGWALLVAFMPAHEHGSISVGPGQWSAPKPVPCPPGISLSINGRSIPLVRDQQYLVLDDYYVVGDLAHGLPIIVSAPSLTPAPMSLSPSSTRVCAWAADDQKTEFCSKTTNNLLPRIDLASSTGAPLSPVAQ